MRQIKEQLQKTILKLLPDTELDRILSRSSKLVYNKGELICKQGAASSHVVFIIKGEAKIYIEAPNKQDIILNIVRDFDFVGFYFLLNSETYSFSLETKTKTTVLLMEKDVIVNALKENKEFMFHFLKTVSMMANKMSTRLVIMQRKNQKGRIADMLLYFAEMYKSNSYTLPLSRIELANMAAISVENTTRILSEFAHDGIINISNKDVELIDANRLKIICDAG